MEGDNLIMPVVMTKTIDQISVPTLVTHRILHKDVKGFNGPVGSFTAPAGHVRESLIQQEDNLRRSAEALEQIYLAAGMTVHTTPQVARSVQATENRWQAMDEEFGLLDSGQVAELLGSKATNRNRAHALSKEGRILGIRRGRGILYPGFQFDKDARQVRTEIADVIAIGRDNGWQDTHLLQWFCSPNGYLDGARPVDELVDHGRLMTAARQDLAKRW